MTDPNPDAELDEALGVAQLPPAAVTDAHRQAARAVPATRSGQRTVEDVAQAIADAEQRGAARVLAEHGLAGT